MTSSMVRGLRIRTAEDSAKRYEQMWREAEADNVKHLTQIVKIGHIING